MFFMGRHGFVMPVCILAAGVIAAGATGDSKDRFTARQRNYWAFQPVRRSQTPVLKQAAWVRNPIDSFILAKLEDKDLGPSPEASKIGTECRSRITTTTGQRGTAFRVAGTQRLQLSPLAMRQRFRVDRTW